jgi:hypothetical protein
MEPAEPDQQADQAEQEDRDELRQGTAVLSAFGEEVLAEFKRHRKLSDQTKLRLHCLITALNTMVEGVFDQDD